MAKIGKLFIDFEAGTASFDRPVRKSRKELSLFGKIAANVKKSTRGLGGGLNRMIAPLAGIAAGFVGVNAVLSNLRSFDQLNARLATATGNSSNAKIAMDSLRGAVTELPFTLEQVTDSFIKLKNFGLDASEDAIKSYAATAAALGKDLDQLIEAVADSAVGEFERLKEFGILTRRQGDQIAFTFKGTTTTVENSSKAIQDFLVDLGNTEFSEGLADQMQTLDGRLTNLADAFFRLSTAILSIGVIKDAVTGLTGLLNDIEINLVADNFKDQIKEAGDSFAEGLEKVVQIDTLHEANLLMQKLSQQIETDGTRRKNILREEKRLLAERIAELETEKGLNEEVAAQTAKTQRIEQGKVHLLEAQRRIQENLLGPAEKLKVLEQQKAEIIEKVKAGEQINLNAAENKIVKLGGEIQTLKDKLNEAKKIGEQFTNSLAEGLARGIVRGGNLLDVLRSVVEQLAVDDLTNLIRSGLKGTDGKSAIGGLFSSVGKLFGGPKANGGPVSMGKSYLVGERGPELFTPRGSGTISANGSFGGMTVNNYFDIRGSDDQIQRQIAASVDMAVSMSVGKMQNMKRRGALA